MNRLPRAAQGGLILVLVAIAGYLWSAGWREERYLREAGRPQLEAYVRQRPDRAKAWDYLARRRAADGDTDAALAASLKAAELAPDDADLWVAAAVLSAEAHGDQAGFEILNNFLKERPDSAKAHEALALLYSKNASHERALQEAIKATSLDPRLPEAWRVASQSSLALTKLDDAAALADRAVETAPDDWRSYEARAKALLAKNQPEAARAAAETAVRLAPKEAMAHRLLGQVYEPDTLKALPHYEVAYNRAPDNPVIALTYGRALLKSPDPKSAAMAQIPLKTAAAHLPHSPDAALALSQMYRKTGDIPAADRENARFTALRQYVSQARDLRLKIQKGEIPEAPGRLTLARLHVSFQDFDEARKQYQLLLARKGENPVARHELAAVAALRRGDKAEAYEQTGRARAAEGRTAEAFFFLRRAIESAPDRNTAQVPFAALLFQTGRPDEAYALLTKYVREHSSNPEAWHELGKVCAANDELRNEAEAAFARAVDIAPQNLTYALNRAELLSRQGKPDAAEAEYRRIGAIYPKDLDWQGACGVFLVTDRTEPEKQQEGETLLRGVLKERPDDAQALFGLASLAEKRGDHKAAVGYLETFLRVPGQRQWADVWFLLSRAYAGAGEKEKAAAARARYDAVQKAAQEEDTAERRAALNPNDAAAQIALARLKAQRQDWMPALRAYKRALALRPNDAALQKETDALAERLGKANIPLPLETAGGGTIETQIEKSGARQDGAR